MKVATEFVTFSLIHEYAEGGRGKLCLLGLLRYFRKFILKSRFQYWSIASDLKPSVCGVGLRRL